MGQSILNYCMKMSGNFNLSHDEFDTMATGTLKSLIADQDFTDVTLACEDNQQIKAHKVILGSYSSTLRKIILSIDQSCPVIYMKGVKYEELRPIINFLYIGETKVSKESLAGFLEIAQDLNIKGLSLNSNDEKEEDKLNYESREEEIKNIGYVEKEDDKMSCESHEEEVKSIGYGEKEEETVIKCEPILTSKIQPIVAQIPDKMPKEKKALQGTKLKEFTCKECGKTCSEKSNLTKHIRSQHEGIVYPCAYCDHKSKQNSHLKGHIKAKHGNEYMKHNQSI